MRVAELGRATGQSVATIKYYLRERLLPVGSSGGAANQADYGEAHVRRLHLIRTLLQIGGVGVAAARRVLAAIDDPGVDLLGLLAVAHQTLPARRLGDAGDADVVAAREDVAAFLAERGWVGAPESPPREQLADALVALRRLGYAGGAEVFASYADVVDGLARDEIAWLDAEASREQVVEGMVVGTIVFESALVALRRLAHERHACARFG